MATTDWRPEPPDGFLAVRPRRRLLLLLPIRRRWKQEGAGGRRKTYTKEKAGEQNVPSPSPSQNDGLDIEREEEKKRYNKHNTFATTVIFVGLRSLLCSISTLTYVSSFPCCSWFMVASMFLNSVLDRERWIDIRISNLILIPPSQMAFDWFV